MRASKDFGHGSTSAFVDFCLTTPSPDGRPGADAGLASDDRRNVLPARRADVHGAGTRSASAELLLARRDGERHLRLWSAGCAGGEEPYSLAITVSAPDPRPVGLERHHLWGDRHQPPAPCRQRPAKACTANWSFPATPDWLRPQFFAKTTAVRLGHPARDQAPGHVLDRTSPPTRIPRWPPTRTPWTSSSVATCSCTSARTPCGGSSRRLDDALRDGGCLFVAPSEASHEFFPQFERVTSQGEIFYRKNAAGGARTGRRSSQATPPTSGGPPGAARLGRSPPNGRRPGGRPNRRRARAGHRAVRRHRPGSRRSATARRRRWPPARRCSPRTRVGPPTKAA